MRPYLLRSRARNIQHLALSTLRFYEKWTGFAQEPKRQTALFPVDGLLEKWCY